VSSPSPIKKVIKNIFQRRYDMWGSLEEWKKVDHYRGLRQTSEESDDPQR